MCIQKKCTEFGFGRRCCDEFENRGCDVDGPVYFYRVAIFGYTA